MKNQISKIVLIAITLTTLNSWALQPPRPGEVATLKAADKFEEQVVQAKKFDNDKIDPFLVRKSQEKLSELTGIPLPTIAAQMGPQLLSGMPSTGTNNVLILLMEFPDYPNVYSYNTISNMINGSGNPAQYPKESLKNYYVRSSYSNLVINGTILPWYEMSHDRDWYTTTYPDDNTCNAEMIKEILDHYNSSVDYSQFDNDNNGYVDYLAVFWSGPKGAWASFWWGYQWSLDSQNITRDGVRFYNFSWQWEDNNPQTVIHETGHALGLPDYYDYDAATGPKGGVGGLDIMGSYTSGDHNCFSKFMLGWIEPTIVVSNLVDFRLEASAAAPQAALIMPNITSPSQAFDEYFMVQNRYRTANDTGIFTGKDGLLIWHVDATPTSPGGSSFKYNNSTSDHKLLRLMEADGLEEIESGGIADAGDYYNAGESFDQGTSPNTDSYYTGVDSDFYVYNISANGLEMTANLLLTYPKIGALNTNVLISTGYSHILTITNTSQYSLDYKISNIDQNWLSLDKTNGAIASLSYENILLLADPKKLTTGDKYANFDLYSSDPDVGIIKMNVEALPEPTLVSIFLAVLFLGFSRKRR